MHRSHTRFSSSKRTRTKNTNAKRRSRDHSHRSRGRGGGNQATFDPTSVVLQSKQQLQKPPEQDQYQPKNSFSDYKIHHQLKKNIERRGYTKPTPIQDQVIPHILQGRDVVGIANTGTGKTAAFLIPLLHKIATSDNQTALIIAPTRELALQIRDEVRLFSQQLDVFDTVCIGGMPLHKQIAALQKNPQIVIGTPGRIKDLNQRRKLQFHQFGTIVLDEVDRMLDMGFVHDIRAIIKQLPKNRHSLFFSATMDDRVRNIMHGFLHNPVTVSVKAQEMSTNVVQDVVKLQGRSKAEVLDNLLRREEFEKVLVFGRTKRGMNQLSKTLQEKGHRVAAIHGNKSQGQRQRALKQFREDKINILVATDVVARGLDVENITHVINYDLPSSFADYVHRIGRTGRANNTGFALTFVS